MHTLFEIKEFEFVLKRIRKKKLFELSRIVLSKCWCTINIKNGNIFRKWYEQNESDWRSFKCF